jgi:hypothetical protein
MRDTMQRSRAQGGDAHEVLVGLMLGTALAMLSAFWWAWVHG